MYNTNVLMLYKIDVLLSGCFVSMLGHILHTTFLYIVEDFNLMCNVDMFLSFLHHEYKICIIKGENVFMFTFFWILLYAYDVNKIANSRHLFCYL